MVRTCFVPHCNSNANTNKKYGIEKITLFKVPKDKKLKDQWEVNCGRSDRRMKDTDYVCSKHFTKDDIWSDFRVVCPDKVVWLKKTKVTLHKNAIPTIFDNAKNDTKRNFRLVLPNSVKDDKTGSSFSQKNSKQQIVSCHSVENGTLSNAAFNCNTPSSYKSSGIYVIKSEESICEFPVSSSSEISIQKCDLKSNLSKVMKNHVDFTTSPESRLCTSAVTDTDLVSDDKIDCGALYESLVTPESDITPESNIIPESGITSESDISSELGIASEAAITSQSEITSDLSMHTESDISSDYYNFLEKVYRFKLPSPRWSSYIQPEQSTVVFLCLDIECKPKITVKFSGNFTPVICINDTMKDLTTLLPTPKNGSDVCSYLNSLDKLKICIGTGLTECPYSKYCIGLLIFNQRNARCEPCSYELKNSERTQYYNYEQLDKSVNKTDKLNYLLYCKKIKYLQYQLQVLKSNVNLVKNFIDRRISTE